MSTPERRERLRQGHVSRTQPAQSSAVQEFVSSPDEIAVEAPPALIGTSAQPQAVVHQPEPPAQPADQPTEPHTALQRPEPAEDPTEQAGDAAWEWTPERERCLELRLLGLPKAQVARDLRKHRNTINNWCDHPAFKAEQERREEEHRQDARQRHSRTAVMFTDRVSKMADQALQSAEKQPLDPISRNSAFAWMDQFRKWRAEERIDMGDNVQRTDSRVGVVVAGRVQHQHSVAAQSFKKFLDTGMTHVDMKMLAATHDPTAAVIHIVERALVDSDLLDQIDEEDRANSAGEEE